MPKQDKDGAGVEARRGNGSSHSRFGGLSTKDGGDVLSWADVDATILRDCIASCVTSGASVSFGKTMDGSALGLTVYDNGERFKFWPSDAAEANGMLKSVARAARMAVVE